MHERGTVMQSGENLAVLVVCDSVKRFLSLYTHTAPSEQNKTHDFPLSFGMMHPLPHFTDQLQCVCMFTN